MRLISALLFLLLPVVAMAGVIQVPEPETLILLGMTLWTAFNLTYGSAGHGRRRTASYWLTVVLLVTLTLQILYGGLVAGLKAGQTYVSKGGFTLKAELQKESYGGDEH